MKKYKANRKGFIYILAVSFIIPVVVYYLSKEETTVNLIIAAVPFFLFLWFYFDTSYKIKGNKLYYRSAFVRGKINIKKIDRIIIGKTMWSGLKPALAAKGLIVTYGYNDIYIAPGSNADMVAGLLEVNPKIEIVHNTK